MYLLTDGGQSFKHVFFQPNTISPYFLKFTYDNL